MCLERRGKGDVERAAWQPPFSSSDRLHCHDPMLRNLVLFFVFALRRIYLHGTDEDASRILERFDPVVLQGRKSLLSRETGENACRSKFLF